MLNYLNELGPTVEVRPEPDERYSCHPEQLGLQTIKKNLMVDCVKSCRQVEAYEYSDLLVVSRRVHSVEYIQQCSLRGMAPPVSRLVVAEVGRVEKVWTQARQHELFDDLRHG